METATYKVHPARLDVLIDKLAKMNRRAARLGVTGVTWTVGALQTKKVDIGEGRSRIDAWHEFVLTVEPIKLAGWTFIATLDHTSEAGVVLRGVPGETIPASYRDAKPVCDHCGYVRIRKETFVVRHDDGTHKQVGRQCVRDFLGADPTVAARTAEFAIAIGEAAEAAFEGDGSHASYTAIDDYVAAVSVACRLWGWTSRKTAREFGKSATADYAFGILYPGRPDLRSAEEKAIQQITDSDRTRAEAAIEWARNLRNGHELNDYEHNLTVVAAGEIVTGKTAGIAASMLPAYEKAQGREIERRKAAAVSVHVGTVGKREVFKGLTVVYMNSWESQYGVTHLYTFADAAGNRIKWFASRDQGWAQGSVVTLKATVKAHGEYQGIKETTVTRATVVDETPAAQDAAGFGNDDFLSK
jgi:hypothetical protein